MVGDCLTKRLVLAGGCPCGQYSSALPSCFSLEAARAWKGYDDPVSRDSGGSDGSSKQENGQPAMRVRSIHFAPVNTSEVVFTLPPLSTLWLIEGKACLKRRAINAEYRNWSWLRSNTWLKIGLFWRLCRWKHSVKQGEPVVKWTKPISSTWKARSSVYHRFGCTSESYKTNSVTSLPHSQKLLRRTE